MYESIYDDDDDDDTVFVLCFCVVDAISQAAR